MIIKRGFYKTKNGRMLSDAAFEKAIPAICEYFECDNIASACYIGDGIYTVICTTSEKTEVDPQETKHETL